MVGEIHLTIYLEQHSGRPSGWIGGSLSYNLQEGLSLHTVEYFALMAARQRLELPSPHSTSTQWIDTLQGQERLKAFSQRQRKFLKHNNPSRILPRRAISSAQPQPTAGEDRTRLW